MTAPSGMFHPTTAQGGRRQEREEARPVVDDAAATIGDGAGTAASITMLFAFGSDAQALAIDPPEDPASVIDSAAFSLPSAPPAGSGHDGAAQAIGERVAGDPGSVADAPSPAAAAGGGADRRADDPSGSPASAARPGPITPDVAPRLAAATTPSAPSPDAAGSASLVAMGSGAGARRNDAETEAESVEPPSSDPRPTRPTGPQEGASAPAPDADRDVAAASPAPQDHDQGAAAPEVSAVDEADMARDGRPDDAATSPSGDGAPPATGGPLGASAAAVSDDRAETEDTDATRISVDAVSDAEMEPAGEAAETANVAPTDIAVASTGMTETVRDGGTLGIIFDAGGQTAAVLSTVDGDDGDAHAYRIVSDPSGLFEIVGDEVRVRSGAVVDHEVQDLHTITVASTDRHGATVTKTFDIAVQNTGGSFSGGSGDDVIVGSSEEDVLSGRDGLDRIDGGEGDDVLEGGDGDDLLFGGLGDDVFRVHGANDGLDQVDGGDGFDRLVGSAAADVFRVESDLANLVSIEAVDGGAGYDRILGTAGDDRLDFSGGLLLVGIEEIDGGAGDDTIVGTDADDVLEGGDGDDLLFGGLGDDVFRVHGANDGLDQVDGGLGEDSLVGSSGSDVFRVTSGFGNLVSVETISGGDGYDVIRGTSGDDVLNLSSQAVSADFLSRGGPSGPAPILHMRNFGAPGDDVTNEAQDDHHGTVQPDGWTLIEDSAAFDLDAGSFAVSWDAPSGGDRYGLFSRDSMYFDGGGHFVVFVEHGQVKVRLQSDSADHYLTAPVVEGQENTIVVVFGQDADGGGLKLFANGVEVGSSAYAGGLGGNDEPIVIGARDWASGDGAADNIDLVFDGEITGVMLFDERLDDAQAAALHPAADPDYVIDADASGDAHAAGPALESIERVDGGDGDDAIIGSDGDDVIDGGRGDDVLTGGLGDDVLVGGDGNDVFADFLGADVVEGGAGDVDALDLAALTEEGEARAWTLELDDGAAVVSDVDGVMTLGDDASGEIVFEDGSSVEFSEIEQINY